MICLLLPGRMAAVVTSKGQQSQLSPWWCSGLSPVWIPASALHTGAETRIPVVCHRGFPRVGAGGDRDDTHPVSVRLLCVGWHVPLLEGVGCGGGSPHSLGWLLAKYRFSHWGKGPGEHRRVFIVGTSSSWSGQQPWYHPTTGSKSWGGCTSG